MSIFTSSILCLHSIRSLNHFFFRIFQMPKLWMNQIEHNKKETAFSKIHIVQMSNCQNNNINSILTRAILFWHTPSFNRPFIIFNWWMSKWCVGFDFTHAVIITKRTKRDAHIFSHFYLPILFDIVLLSRFLEKNVHIRTGDS